MNRTILTLCISLFMAGSSVAQADISVTDHVSISDAEGIQVFNINNGNLMYKIRSQILSAYNNAGDQTIRINSNLSGDGRITTDELEITGGSDLAEYFDVIDHENHSVLPGMMVSVLGEAGKLGVTVDRYDKKVVGIISGANEIETGMMMGQKGSIAHGEHPIALTGRTYVFATSENGSIQPGDFLTSSSKPGYAMKVKKLSKAKGAIVGKALTSLDKEDGFVLVLVNLQ